MRPSGHRWRIFTQLVFRTYGDICHLGICGHGGARCVDHLEPVTEDPGSAFDLSNCRPAHGAPGNPCGQCTASAGRKIFCNQIRGMGSIQRAQRIIAERIAEGTKGKPVTPRVRKGALPRPPERQEDPGRAW